MHRALVGEDVRRERHGQLRVEQLQALFLSRQAEDLVLEPLVLLLQGVERLEHLHDCKGGEEISALLGSTSVTIMLDCNKLYINAYKYNSNCTNFTAL